MSNEETQKLDEAAGGASNTERKTHYKRPQREHRPERHERHERHENGDDSAEDSSEESSEPINKGKFYGRTMNLKELKLKNSNELLDLAEESGVENAGGMLKQDLVFAILKK